MKAEKIKYISGIAVLFFVTAFCLYYMDDGYFNTILAKTDAYYISTAVTVCVWVVMSLISYFTGIVQPARARDLIRTFIICFAVSYVVSALISGNADAAFSGDKGWYVGVVSYLCGLLMYITMRDLKPRWDISVIIIAAASVMFFIFAVCHGAGIDVFSLHRELLTEEKHNYISTAGNIDVFAGVVSLILPSLSAGYLAVEMNENTSAHKRFRGIFLLICIALASYGASFAGVDSAYIGMYGGLAILFMMISRRKCPLIYINRIMIVVSASISLTEFIQHHDTYSFPVTKYISFYLDKYHIAIICLIITAIIGLCLHHKKDYVIDWKILLTIVLAVILLAVIFFVHGAEKSDDFGNSRVRIWETALSVYADGNIVEKIFGVGCDCFGLYSGTLEVGGRSVVNCHCEILQHLVCGGILTVVMYILVICAVIWKVYRSRKVSPFFYGLSGYIIQAQINNPHNLLMPFVFMFLAML